MWLVLCWAWEGRKHRARTIPMPELVCRVKTELSTMPGLLLLPLLSPISQQNCHPPATALWDCMPGTNGTCSHTCSELCGKTVQAAEVCWRTEVVWLCRLLLVQFLLPFLVFLNNETVQKQQIDPFCSSRTSKSEGLAQQMKS